MHGTPDGLVGVVLVVDMGLALEVAESVRVVDPAGGGGKVKGGIVAVGAVSQKGLARHVGVFERFREVGEGDVVRVHGHLS